MDEKKKNLPNNSPKILPDDFLENFDADLQQFYFDVISKEVDLSKRWHAVNVKRALDEVVKAYRKSTVKSFCSSIQFDTPAKRSVYLLKHGPCFTSAVAKYLLKLVQKNPKILEESLRKGEFSICCLGGGPASDAVAVAKIIRGLYRPYYIRTRTPLKLTVNVVDISKDWCVTAENLLESLNDTPEFVGRNEVNIVYKFHYADLSEKLEEDVKSVIKSADIVTMIYFLSAVNGSAAIGKSQSMLETIILNMKRGGFLFFLDSAADLHYEVLFDAAFKRCTMEEIYGPLAEEFHTISTRSMAKFLDLYSTYLYNYMCMTNVFLAVSSWRKPNQRSVVLRINRTISDMSSKWEKPTKEKSDELTREMRDHRTLVRRMLYRRFNLNNKKDYKTQNSIGESSAATINQTFKLTSSRPLENIHRSGHSMSSQSVPVS